MSDRHSTERIGSILEMCTAKLWTKDELMEFQQHMTETRKEYLEKFRFEDGIDYVRLESFRDGWLPTIIDNRKQVLVVLIPQLLHSKNYGALSIYQSIYNKVNSSLVLSYEDVLKDRELKKEFTELTREGVGDALSVMNVNRWISSIESLEVFRYCINERSIQDDVVRVEIFHDIANEWDSV